MRICPISGTGMNSCSTGAGQLCVDGSYHSVGPHASDAMPANINTMSLSLHFCHSSGQMHNDLSAHRRKWIVDSLPLICAKDCFPSSESIFSQKQVSTIFWSAQGVGWCSLVIKRVCVRNYERVDLASGTSALGVASFRKVNTTARDANRSTQL